MAKQDSDYLSYMRLVAGLYILIILQEEPAYGHRLAEEITRRTQNAYTPNTNVLYPLLRIMEHKGYIIGEWDRPTTRNKRVYTITQAGIDRIPALKAILKERISLLEWKMGIFRADLLG